MPEEDILASAIQVWNCDWGDIILVPLVIVLKAVLQLRDLRIFHYISELSGT